MYIYYHSRSNIEYNMIMEFSYEIEYLLTEVSHARDAIRVKKMKREYISKIEAPFTTLTK